MTRQTPRVTIGGVVQILHPLIPSYLMCDCGIHFLFTLSSLTFISQYWQLWAFYAACTFILLIAIAQVETDVSTVQYSTLQYSTLYIKLQHSHFFVMVFVYTTPKQKMLLLFHYQMSYFSNSFDADPTQTFYC